jgi:ribosome-associated protein
MSPPRLHIPFGELRFETSRSGGPGGQNVNKVETKARLHFAYESSDALTTTQKSILSRAAAVQRLLNAEGEIVITSQIHRTQRQNKEAAVKRLVEILESALKPRPKRVPTRVPRSSIQTRLRSKARRSQRKQERRGGEAE